MKEIIFINNDTYKTDNIASLLQNTRYVEQGEGVFGKAGNKNSLTTLGLATCIGVGFYGKNHEHQRYYLMHLDNFLDCKDGLKLAYQSFQTKPQVIFFALRGGSSTQVKALKKYTESDNTFDFENSTLDLETLDCVPTQEKLNYVRQQLNIDPEIFDQIFKQLKIPTLANLVCVLETNAKIRAVLHLLNLDAEDLETVQIVDVPCDNIMISEKNMYVDENYQFSSANTDCESDDSESEDILDAIKHKLTDAESPEKKRLRSDFVKIFGEEVNHPVKNTSDEKSSRTGIANTK